MVGRAVSISESSTRLVLAMQRMNTIEFQPRRVAFEWSAWHKPELIFLTWQFTGHKAIQSEAASTSAALLHVSLLILFIRMRCFFCLLANCSSSCSFTPDLLRSGWWFDVVPDGSRKCKFYIRGWWPWAQTPLVALWSLQDGQSSLNSWFSQLNC